MSRSRVLAWCAAGTVLATASFLTEDPVLVPLLSVAALVCAAVAAWHLGVFRR